MDKTYYVTLVQKKDGLYTIYVFQQENGEYLMCTKLPNWGIYNINKGDCGYVTVTYAVAGTEYYERTTGEKKIYKFDQCYFKDWIPDNAKSADIIL